MVAPEVKHGIWEASKQSRRQVTRVAADVGCFLESKISPLPFYTFKF